MPENKPGKDDSVNIEVMKEGHIGNNQPNNSGNNQFKNSGNKSTNNSVNPGYNNPPDFIAEEEGDAEQIKIEKKNAKLDTEGETKMNTGDKNLSAEENATSYPYKTNKDGSKPIGMEWNDQFRENPDFLEENY